MGTFKAPCKIGPIETIVEFHVMNITPNYNLLLGRAWLHPNGAIHSSLHQKMKIPWKMSGFEFVNMVDYGLKDERYATNLFPYYTHEVIAMMKNMGCMPSMALEKKENG